MSKDPTWPDDLHEFARDNANATPDAPELPPEVVEALKALGGLRGVLIEIQRNESAGCHHEHMARLLLTISEKLQRECDAKERVIFALLHLMGDRAEIPDSISLDVILHARRIVYSHDPATQTRTLLLVNK
jgi:hypothetical protein